VSAAGVASERPDVARVLRGRTAAQVAQMVPPLFALCCQAQARAASLALAAAHGNECEPQLDSGVQREVLREHLWHWLLDLPPLLGMDALQQEYVTAAGWIAEGRRKEILSLLASPRIAALHRHLQQLEEVHPVSSRLLPVLDAQNSLAEWPRLSTKFCRLPDWRGRAAETGALARQPQKNGNPTSFFSDRWLARFDELLQWASSNEQVGAGGTVSAMPVARGIGRSLVETARGVLMHEVVLDGERVADYLIAAPTEWNFHPQGMLVDYLLGHESPDRNALQRHVALTVAALDPCVPWVLEWA
jgi:hypothetical protein